METILKNVLRHGNITSSEVVALTKKCKEKGSLGAPALTYIDECNMERRLGRSLTDEVSARPLSWGKLCEKRVEQLLPTSYALCSDITLEHPTIDCWKGTPDATVPTKRTVCDIKCPMTLKSFCTFIDSIVMVEINGVWVMDGTATINAIRANHKDGEKYYWQIVSNAVLTDSVIGELIIYVPYKSELDEIKGIAADELNKYYWIVNAQEEELPYLIDDGYYKNLNIISFLIPEEDKLFLTERVLTAKQKLITFNA